MKQLFLLLLACVCSVGAAEFPWLNFDKFEDYQRVLRDGDRVLRFTQRKFLLYTYDSPRAAAFDCTLRSNSPARIRVSYVVDGKYFQAESAPFSPGRNRVRVEIPQKGTVRIASFEAIADAGKPEIEFHRATLEYDTAAAGAFRVGFVRPDKLNFFRPGEKIELRLANCGDREAPYELEVKFTAFSGKTVTFRAAGKTGAGEDMTIPVPALPLLGQWDVEWNLRSGGGVANGKTALAILPDLPDYRYRKGDFMFGMCAHSGRWPLGDRELEAKLAARLGVNFVRTGVDWSNIQPGPDANDFDYRTFDSLVDIYGKQGIELQGMLGFTAKLAAPEPLRSAADWKEWNRAKPDLELWRKYAEKTVGRYKGKINIWEIWNEPDLRMFSHFDVKDYLDLARVASEAIRKTAPEALVFSAGFAGLAQHPNRPDPDFQFKAMRDGKQYFDVHAYHGHAGFVPFSEQIDRKLMPLRKEAGVAIPWYANETAVFSLNGADKAQAVTLFKKLLFCWARGSLGYNWYDLRNDGFNFNDPENTFGTVTFEYEPKPVASVYHTLARFLRGARFVEELKLPEGCRGYRFRNGRDQFIGLWNEDNGFAGPVPVEAPGAARVERIHCMGNRAAVPFADGLFCLELSTQPSLYRVENADEIRVHGALVDLVSAPVVGEGKFPATLTARNPLGRPLRLNVRLPGGEGMEIPLAPGETKTLPLQAPGAKNLKLSYALAGSAIGGEVDVPLRRATLIPRGGGDYRRKPDFRLDKVEQVTSIGEGDPAMRDRTWTGPGDLSASAWLREDGEWMELYVSCRDDAFVQKGGPKDLWKNDSLQVALVIPGQDGGWKIDLARLENGRSSAYAWIAPAGFSPEKAAGAIVLTTNRDEEKKVTGYRARFPFAAFGLSREKLKEGIRFNLLINDNDGAIRETYMQLFPGLSQWNNLSYFPLIVFE